jgi:hypothetical protein
MKTILKDLNGNVFEHCFVCGKDWDTPNTLQLISCDACNIIASPDETYKDQYKVWRTIGKYDIGYFKGNSNILDNTKLYDNSIIDNIPLLPYDITLEKLKMFILFS